MKVTCIATEGAEVAKRLTNDTVSAQLRACDKYRLTIGKTYVVYAIEVFRSEVSYYVWGEEDLCAPGEYAAQLFEVVDPRPSSCWHCQTMIRDHSFCLCISFPEWSADPSFRSRLFDDDQEAYDLWSHYRKLMDSE